jgi:hypothetical protein
MFNYKKMFIINLDMNLEWFLCGMATSILISLATCIRLAQPNNGVRWTESPWDHGSILSRSPAFVGFPLPSAPNAPCRTCASFPAPSSPSATGSDAAGGVEWRSIHPDSSSSLLFNFTVRNPELVCLNCSILFSINLFLYRAAFSFESLFPLCPVYCRFVRCSYLAS